MSNPEHSLWTSFIVLACEARGMEAFTESNVMKSFEKDAVTRQPKIQGLTEMSASSDHEIQVDAGDPSKKLKPKTLRPDAVALEGDLVTWFEIDKSKRGSVRVKDLKALVSRVGRTLNTGQILRRVVVHTVDDENYKRNVQILRRKMKEAAEVDIIETRGNHYREIDEGTFEVIAPVWDDKASRSVLQVVGHVIIQPLPTWMPKVRLDASNKQPISGWFEENYLPYRRPKGAKPWPMPQSPLLRQHKNGAK